MSDASLHARPQSSEPTEKTTRPTMNTRLRPSRSARAPAEEQESAEHERVGADHPLQVLLREVEIGLDGGERDVHDRDVEHHHELHAAEER